MTVPSEPFTQQAADDESIEIPPIPVYVVSKPIRDLAPHYGGAEAITVPTASLPAGTQGYATLLARRPGRHKARIRNNDGANLVILAETTAKVQAGQGYGLPAGGVVEWESQQPLYAVALTAPVLVSVIDESFLLPDDES